MPKVHLQPCASSMNRTGSGPGRPRLWGRSEGSGDKWTRKTRSPSDHGGRARWPVAGLRKAARTKVSLTPGAEHHRVPSHGLPVSALYLDKCRPTVGSQKTTDFT